MPGRVGSPWLPSGKTDFVANFCGTYSMYPAQMFDRRVETMNSLFLGLRAYELSTKAKMLVKNRDGQQLFTNEGDASRACMVFFQYMPFSSRVAAVIDQVTAQHEDDLHRANGWDPEVNLFANKLTPDEVRQRMDADAASGGLGRTAAAKKVGATKQRSSLSDYNTPFDKCTYDPIRTEDLQHMVGAWHVGRVLDTKAARHDPYAGGPRDTAFSCIVDVGISWRSAVPFTGGDPNMPTETALDRSQATPSQKKEQQSNEYLTNHAQPALREVLGKEFGRLVSEEFCGKFVNYASAAAPSVAEQQAAKQREEAAKVAAEEEAAREAALEKEKSAAKKARRAPLLSDAQLITMLKDLGVTETRMDNPMLKVRAAFAAVGEAIRASDAAVTETDGAWAGGYIATIQSRELSKKENKDKAKKARATARKNFLTRAKVEINEMVDQVSNKVTMADQEAWAEALQKITDAIEAEVVIVTTDLGKIEGANVQEERKVGMKARYTSRAQLTIDAMEAALQILYKRSKIAEDETEYEPFQGDDTGATLQLRISLDSATRACAHVLALCEVHEEHFDHYGFDMGKSAAAAAATGSKAPSGSGRARSKTPPKSRQGVPAAAASASSTPLVPTSASPIVDAVAAAASAASSAFTSAIGSAAPPAVAPVAATPAAVASSSTTSAAPAPRRRAREGGESSTVNSVFETMFASSPTAAAPEEPASPTPSSGSDQPTPGPRTFRRIQR